MDEVTEVSNYVAALDHELWRMRGGFLLPIRPLREMHGILLRSGRGAAKQPETSLAHDTGSPERAPEPPVSSRRLQSASVS